MGVKCRLFLDKDFSSNRGSAIAKIVGLNVMNQPDVFEKEVLMYVYEEIIDGAKLTDIINLEHENVKYLPDIKISPNVVIHFVSIGLLKLVTLTLLFFFFNLSTLSST